MSENFIPSQSSKPKHFTKALGRPWPKHGINLSQTNNLTKKDGNITKLLSLKQKRSYLCHSKTMLLVQYKQ